MAAIDTNILVRILINDPQEATQTQIARQLLFQEKQVYVPQIVQVECVWVLERAYKVPKQKLIEILSSLYESPVFVLQHESLFASALEKFRESNVGFADCLILAESQTEKLELLTFDKKLGKIIGCKLLT
jgi:predicted nucleic-acid-binding protein